MTQVSKVPVKSEHTSTPATVRGGDMFRSLRQEIDQVFDSFNRGLSFFPFGRSLFGSEPGWSRQLLEGIAPAVDIAEKEKEYTLTAELPGLGEHDVEVRLSNGMLTLRGQKSEEKEERKQDYHLSERRYGSFQRSFALPTDVDCDKIVASFKNGVLTVSLPKTAEALKSEKKIEVKAA